MSASISYIYLAIGLPFAWLAVKVSKDVLLVDYPESLHNAASFFIFMAAMILWPIMAVAVLRDALKTRITLSVTVRDREQVSDNKPTGDKS